MALNAIFQTAISLNKLYKVNRKAVNPGEAEQLRTSLYINSGKVNVYGYNGASEPSSLSDMTLNSENEGVFGTVPFSTIPTYIAVEQNDGTTTELVVSGLDVNEIEDIS